MGGHEEQRKRKVGKKGHRRTIVVTAVVSPSPEWVRRNVPYKLELGQKTVRWHQHDVLDWLQSKRTPAA